MAANMLADSRFAGGTLDRLLQT
ncbi:hypothetical protein PTD2_21922 [Pseudoalteromonas tunicata D2]|uniref:Uncharacterized protein n=1 Tax=Pseudoalteromonas tunicata D2 TaxID=87626 RepID=A4CAW0_9GAMM|nr:hypothetical protein PTD2_21922 [Pseudoalteromonas tunicata D2]